MKLAGRADLASLTMECDGASGNDKFFAFMRPLLQRQHPNLLVEKHWCGSHAHHLAAVGMVTCLSPTAVNDLYAACNFLAPSGHWARMLKAV